MIYGTPEQCKEHPDIYESLPEGYVLELFKKIVEMQDKNSKKNLLEKKISLN